MITCRFTRYDQMFEQHTGEYLLGASETVLESSYSEVAVLKSNCSGSEMPSWEFVQEKDPVITCSLGAYQRELQQSKVCSFYETCAGDAPYQDGDLVSVEPSASCSRQQVRRDNRAGTRYLSLSPLYDHLHA